MQLNFKFHHSMIMACAICVQLHYTHRVLPSHHSKFLNLWTFIQFEWCETCHCGIIEIIVFSPAWLHANAIYTHIRSSHSTLAYVYLRFFDCLRLHMDATIDGNATRLSSKNSFRAGHRRQCGLANVLQLCCAHVTTSLYRWSVQHSPCVSTATTTDSKWSIKEDHRHLLCGKRSDFYAKRYCDGCWRTELSKMPDNLFYANR